MKKLSVLFAVILVLTMFAGCAGKTGDTNQTTSGTTKSGGASGETTTAGTTQKAGTKELLLWNVWTGVGGETIQSICDDFNSSQKDYFVNCTFSGTYPETLAKFQAASKGSRPEMVMVSTEMVAFMMDNPDYYVPVQKYVVEDNYDVSDIAANLRSSYTDNEGNLMCAPLGNTVVGFFYNNELLKKAGIDPLTDLNSYDEIYKACQTLCDDYGVEYGFHMTPNSIYYTFPATAEGLDLVDNNNGKDDVPTKSLIAEEPLKSATTKFFQFLKNLNENGYLSPITLSGLDVQKAFVNGDIAMITSTISGLTAIGELCNWELDFGFHPAPTISEGATNLGQCTGGGTIFLGNNGDEAAERGSWEFMKFLMKPENTAKFAMGTGYLPTTESGAQTPEYKKFVEEKFPTAVYSMEAQKATSSDVYNAYLPMFSDFHQIVNEYYSKVVEDKAYTAEQATLDLAKDIDESIELYRMSRK